MFELVYIVFYCRMQDSCDGWWGLGMLGWGWGWGWGWGSVGGAVLDVGGFYVGYGWGGVECRDLK